MIVSSSTPTIDEFDPTIIPSQYEVMKLVRKDYDYSKGCLEILLSGSLGSAKSILVAHLIATHALMNPGAGILVGRRTLKDLKNTIWKTLLTHCPQFYQYWNKAEMKINLPNSSIIYGVSWDDGNYEKFRSYELSMGAIEELTENKDKKLYDEIKNRVGRCLHVKETLMIGATNPDSPSHWAHPYFIERPAESRRVIYSKTYDNPFLPKWYVRQLKENLDPKMALRMIEGQWVEIHTDQVYYNYDEQRNFVNEKYQFEDAPICLYHDFNIGHGKPMSAGCGQYIDGMFHLAKEYVVEGARTGDIMEEIADSGVLDQSSNIIYVYGDASGKNNDTRSLKDDYEIIRKFLSNYERKDGRNLEVLINVPTKNPPIRRRHNTVNASFLNDNNEIRLKLYQGCERTSKGFKLTQLKTSGSLIEDDSLPEQHITTAVGYWVDFVVNRESGESSKVIQL